MPAPLLPRGFDDLLLDNVVSIATAFSAQQVAIAPANPLRGFRVNRDLLAAPSDSDLYDNGPMVVFTAPQDNPRTGTSRDTREGTLSVQGDLYVAGLDGTGNGDKKAMARLSYLKAQVWAALFAKSATDFGFSPGTARLKPTARFQMTPQAQPGEAWVCGGSWVFEWDYTFNAQDLDMVDLEQVAVSVGKDFAQLDPYTQRWAGLYNVG